MARTTDQIIADAEALARKFEAGELPDPVKTLDGRPLRDVREAFEDLAHAERRLVDRITMARAAGHSWASIGMMVGTSGEAVRQRYSKPALSTLEKAVIEAADSPKTGPAVAKATSRVAKTAKGAPAKAAPAKKAATGAKVVKGKSSAGFAQGRRNSA